MYDSRKYNYSECSEREIDDDKKILFINNIKISGKHEDQDANIILGFIYHDR